METYQKSGEILFGNFYSDPANRVQGLQHYSSNKIYILDLKD
jgi:hypothetical protein